MKLTLFIKKMNVFLIIVNFIKPSVQTETKQADFTTETKQIETTDYCKIDCGGKKHIGCDHPNTPHTKCPKGKIIYSYGKDMQDYIVNLHNEKRNIMAGKLSHYRAACRMSQMQWDNELAKLAERNAEQCTVYYDECRNTEKFKHAGQSIFFGGYREKTVNHKNIIQGAVDYWFRQHGNCNKFCIKNYPNNPSVTVERFALMINERNTHIGCAATTAETLTEGIKAYTLICNYATSNRAGHAVYKACKTPAYKCKSRSFTYPNLCSLDEEYDVNAWPEDNDNLPITRKKRCYAALNK